jgi:demethylmenaquinone methyltransferase/2-methoxy-6-polyprenyl-1,4-benzoquinol methylase
LHVADPDDTVSDDDLLAEQRAFYRWDAEDFDGWLTSLAAEDNDDQVAVTYRLGRDRIAAVFAARAPLGRVLEIAAGTGRLAELYLPHAESVVLLDASPESLALASRRLPVAHGSVTFVEDDVFAWQPAGLTFDTIVFSAWLHHVPHSQFDGFWDTVASVLAPGGEVIFDFPDARVDPPGLAEVRDEPTDDYSLYVPVDGVSVRDHHGRRWRVVHNLWDPAELSSSLGSLGWTMDPLGPGLFDNVVWASARRGS